MSATVRDRLGAVTGAAFVVLVMVGNEIATAGSGRSAHPTGDQVLRDAAHQASSASVAAAKRSIYASWGSFEDALLRERTEQLKLLRSADSLEGVAAWMQKREPNFQGR